LNIKSVEHNFLLGPVGLQNHQKTTNFEEGPVTEKNSNF